MASSTLEDLPARGFTDETIRRMYGLVDRAKTDEKFQKLIYTLVNRRMPGQWKDYRGEIGAVFDWFRRRHDYRRDPYGVEMLQDVWATMDRRRFDCDDSSVFLAAAAEVLGAPARFITVSTRADKDPSHVYPQAFVGGRWEAMDATVPHAYLGWEPQGVTDKKVWDRKTVGLSGDDLTGIEGLGMDNGNGFYKPTDDGRTYPENWGDDFYGTMTPVLPPEGISNQVSKTWTHPNPTELLATSRLIPSDLIAETNDQHQMERTGGGRYNEYDPPYAIESQPVPSELRTVIPRGEIPMVFNPDEWTGRPPDAVSDMDYTLPSRFVKEEFKMRDLAGLGDTAELLAFLPAATQIVKQWAATGQIAPDASTFDKMLDFASKYLQAKYLTPQAAATAPVPTVQQVKTVVEKEILPSWLLPVGIGVGALLLVSFIARR